MHALFPTEDTEPEVLDQPKADTETPQAPPNEYSCAFDAPENKSAICNLKSEIKP